MGFVVSAENGEASRQENEMFAEPENVNDIQEDLFNDIYDKATKVSLIFLKHIVILLSHKKIYLFVKTHLNVSLCERNSFNIYVNHFFKKNIYVNQFDRK